jgi:hypothetical protein
MFAPNPNYSDVMTVALPKFFRTSESEANCLSVEIGAEADAMDPATVGLQFVAAMEAPAFMAGRKYCTFLTHLTPEEAVALAARLLAKAQEAMDYQEARNAATEKAST